MLERIELNDGYLDTCFKLSEGNPGALSVLVRCYEEGAKIDPDSSLGPLTGAVDLDIFQIHGPNIWILYKDVCDQSLVTMLGLLRAVQLGFSSQSELKASLNGDMTEERKADLLQQVRNYLPGFQRAPVSPA